MYKLENNVAWTDDLKNAFKHGVTKGKIVYKENNVVSGEGQGISLNQIDGSKNIYSSTLELGTIDATTGNNESSNNCIRSKDYIKVEPSTTYTIQNSNLYREILYFYDGSKTFISASSLKNGTVTFTTPANCYYLRNRTATVDVENDLTTKFQLELGSVATSYEPYVNKFAKFGVKGNRKQTTYEGKNLCGLPNQTFTLNLGVEVTIQDGEITLNGTANTGGTKSIEPIDTTILRGNYSLNNIYISGSVSSTNTNFNIRNASDNSPILTTSFMQGNNFNTINIDSDTSIVFGLYFTAGVTYNNYKFKPQLIIGTEADYNYEPYVGGYSSPNPDYPQDVYAVGDNGTVNTIICNKNIVNFPNPNYTSNVTASFQNDTLTLVGNSAQYAAVRYNILNFLKQHAGETLSFNFENITIDGTRDGTIVQINATDENGRITYHTLVRADLTKSTYTVPNDIAKYTEVNLQIYTNNHATAHACTLTITKPILYLGTDETSYTLHQHQTYTIPVQKPMADETDYFDWDNEKEIHGWKKVVFDGTENWSMIADRDYDGTYLYQLVSLSDAKAPTDNNSTIGFASNCFEKYSANVLWNTATIGIGLNIEKRIRLRTTQSSLADFKAWLVEQYTNNTPVYLWYELETAEELAFTTAQKTVANQIKNAISYPEQTNIYSTDNVSPVFDIEAYTIEETEVNYDNGLKEITIEDNVYVPDMGFIGQATAKKATIVLLDNEQIINLENKEFDIYIGADYNNQTYYINYGKFIVNEVPENDSTNGTIKVIAYDYMIKFNKIYEDQVTYPLTLKKYLINICNQAGVMIGTESFTNDSFLVTDNQFEGKQLREVLKHVGKSAFSWARIGQDSRLYLDFEVSETTEGFNLFEPVLEVEGTAVNNNNCSVTLEDDVLVFAATGTDMYFGSLRSTGNTYGYNQGQLIKIPSSGKVYLKCSNNDINKNYINFFDKDKKSLGFVSLGYPASSGSAEIPNGARYCTVRVGRGNAVSGTTYKTKVTVSTFAEVFEIDDYKLDGYKKANEYYGPINKVTYGDSDIQGQELSVPAVDPVDVKELVINDNYFGYTLEKRNELIQGGTILFGFTYMPVSKLDLTGAVYLDCTDSIKVKDEDNNEIITRVFSHTIKYNGIISDSVTTEGISDNQQTYENMNTPVSTTSRAEISVDRANRKIQSIVSEIGDRSQKTTTITQDIDGIESKVEDIEDLTNTVSGNKTVTISDAYVGSNIVELHIYGNNHVFDYLYPSDNLYPANDLFPYGDSKLRFYNSIEDKTIELGILEVLRSNNEAKDEVFIDNTDVYLIRRVNANGTTKTTPETTLLGNLNFVLAEGDNTFEIVNYSAPISVKYVTKNDYTDVFATKIEMNSSITQTAEEINLEVSKKINTEEAVSLISQTAEEINLEVSKKVGEDEVISKINQSAEAVGISANKINLTANNIINLLAGNEINLASKNITIKADDILINNQGMSFIYNNANIGRFVTDEIDGDSSKRGVLMDITNNAYFLALGKQDANGVTQQILAFYNRATSSHDTAIQIGNPNWNTFVTVHHDLYVYGYISGAEIINRSLEEIKRDIKKSNVNAINEVMNTDIYTYKLKEEKDDSKKHYGIVIGDKYKYSKEIVNEDNTGVKLYSMVSILWKAVQEQQEQIEQLQAKIKELEEK